MSNFKILPITLNWTLSEKWTAIPNPNPNPNPIIEKNTTIYRAKTYILGSKIRQAGGGANEGL